VLGVLGGVLLLTVIQVGLAIVNVPSFYVGMIGGVMIFIAVAIDAFRVRYFG
jgi:monosaccharide ABC transporter membrane protein, CUT2 family (TC 3.A.1.2.-)